MTRRCTVCTHSRRDAIDKALIAGEPLRNIVKNVPHCSIGSLHRHKGHLSATLIKAEEAREVAHADTLLEQLKQLQKKALELLSKAEAAGDLRTALQGVREAKGCLELLAKLQGDLAQEGTVNITLSPAWLSLRTVILQTLEPYPEAKLRLSQVLKETESASN